MRLSPLQIKQQIPSPALSLSAQYGVRSCIVRIARVER